VQARQQASSTAKAAVTTTAKAFPSVASQRVKAFMGNINIASTPKPAFQPS
jgi:hypothetical protein